MYEFHNYLIQPLHLIFYQLYPSPVKFPPLQQQCLCVLLCWVPTSLLMIQLAVDVAARICTLGGAFQSWVVLSPYKFDTKHTKTQVPPIFQHHFGCTLLPGPKYISNSMADYRTNLKKKKICTMFHTWHQHPSLPPNQSAQADHCLANLYTYNIGCSPLSKQYARTTISIAQYCTIQKLKPRL